MIRCDHSDPDVNECTQCGHRFETVAAYREALAAALEKRADSVEYSCGHVQQELRRAAALIRKGECAPRSVDHAGRPCTLSLAGAIWKQYAKEHRRCKPRQESKP